MSDKFYVGDNLIDFQDIKREKPVDRVLLLYDEENGFSAAPDGSGEGLELTAECYFATADIAEKVRAALSGYRYHAYAAQGADIDPAAEPGDGLTLGGIYSTLSRYADDGEGYPDAEAPGEAELEEEFPTEGPLTRQLKDKITLGADYYGTRITRAKGLEVVRTGADGTETARAMFNADALAFYDDNGAQALYFDPTTGRYMFQGDIVVTGNINLSQGSITWGGNEPGGGISEWEAVTIINRELVSSPNIAGGKFWDADPESDAATAYLQMFQQDDYAAGFLGYFYPMYSSDEPVFDVGCLTFVEDEGPSYGCMLRMLGREVLSYFDNGSFVRPVGAWDFSLATVTGLYLRYA